MTRRGLLVLLLAAPGLLLLQACTDLEETPVSSLVPETFFGDEEELLSGLAAIYAQLRNTLPGTAGTYYHLSEVSSDEMIVPTRGSDWYDNGKWLELQRQTWGPNTVGTLGDVNGAWVQAFTGVTRANFLLEALDVVTIADKEVIEAEVRTLRAFFYYMLSDLFGGVPIVEDTELEQRARNTRAEVFSFIEQELLAARDVLPELWTGKNEGRVTSGAANAILASLYLNAGVFTKDEGISVSGYNSCQTVAIGAGTACDAAIEAADRILNSGAYALAPEWRDNFRPDNHLSPENILVVKHVAADGLGFQLLMTTLHYNMFTPTPWNGWSAEAEAYYTFDEDDQRRDIFLVGPQVSLDTGEPAEDRQGNPLVFTPEITNVEAATEGEGARIGKWTPDPERVAQHSGNDFAYFRLAEIYLIKAEALNEIGQTGEAVALVNMLRERVFDPDEPITAASQADVREAILQERLFELTFEAKRRQDQIRFGQFTQAWQHKPAAPAHVVLMPIPLPQMDANPMLEQNAGY
ncbi:MAG: RagB/SusD family nutrient uptake outer membrane protein [Gemmatimonadetes bacterium]|nr:RagB/SusD family nutrient uptake outer membrane protein [Gemmatimonadota bacterium]